MRIKILFAIIPICISVIIANAQDGFVVNDFEKTMKVFDANGRSFVNPAVDIAGTPFFTEKWKSGSIRSNNNAVYNNISVRLDLQNQEVHFLSQKNVEMVVEPGFIKEIIFFDSVKNEKVQYSFQCGFPSVDNKNEKDFYLVLSDGKLKFLESLRKKIYEEKDVLSGERTKEFRVYENYYFFFNNKIELIKKNKAYLLTIMKDKENKIEDFVKTNNLSCKTIDDIKKIVAYYNSL